MEYSEKLSTISKIVNKSKKVNSFNNNEENECTLLAHSLLDIEESSKEIVNTYLPKLFSNDIKEEEIDDILYDIGEELRHILYHINSSKFYGYLKNSTEAPSIR